MDAATKTMVDNLPAKTGRSLTDWFSLLDQAAPATHGQGLALVKSHGVSHGYANLIVSLHRDRGTEQVDLVAPQFAGRKAGLRPLYDRIVEVTGGFGSDVGVAPRKPAVALRRTKQFAYLEVPNASRLRIGLNLTGLEPTDRLVATSGMCSHRVDIAAPEEIDDELIGWLLAAYERA